MSNKQIVTIATGKRLYIDMAVNLANSFLHWHSTDDVKFYLYTDQPGYIPDYLTAQIEVVSLRIERVGRGFSSKLFLDEISPDGQTIFINSDCLIFENLDYLFDKFKGHCVSVVGCHISEGEWFGDIKSICQKMGISKMPKFNGGLYYLEKGDKATQVYETARKLEPLYDDIGFVRLRGRPNDEVLMAVAMELCGETPIIDDGTIMSDPQACPGGYDINVIKGKRWLINPPPGNPGHQNWYPFQKVSPAIVHFLGFYTNHYPYRREVYKLKMHSLNKLNPYTRLFAYLSIQLPEQVLNTSKKMFRPLYHYLFGYRRIKQSDRIV